MTDRTRESSRVLLPLLVALSLPAGCAGDGGKPVTTGKRTPTPAKSDGGKAAADQGDGANAGDAGNAMGNSGDSKVAAGAAGAADAEDNAKATAAEPADPVGASGGTDGAAGGAVADADSGAVDADAGQADAGAADGGTAAGADVAPTPDPKALLKEVGSRRTKDDRANAALAEAEAAGASIRDLARAAHKRGKALHRTPERARVFFEWALAKNPKYPDPAFELAKAEVNKGELAAAIKHLTEVKKRGGKKLLSQIDFDPMWDVIKDDPDVRKLLRR